MGKRLATHGGPGRERQLKLWKEGALSTWVLSIEIGSLHRQLQRQFKKLEVQNQRLTSDLKVLKEKRKEETQQLQSQLRTIQTVAHRALTGIYMCLRLKKHGLIIPPSIRNQNRKF